MPEPQTPEDRVTNEDINASAGALIITVGVQASLGDNCSTVR